MCSFNDGPVGEAVNHNEVVHPFVGEEVRTDALEGVGQGGLVGTGVHLVVTVPCDCSGHSWLSEM